MVEAGVEGYLVPRADEWQGEFVAHYAERLKWLTGFTGSAGQVVILKDKAALFTDGRYTLQAASQLDPQDYQVINIMEQSPADWLSGQGHIKIGYDPRLHTIKAVNEMKEKGLSLEPLNNLIDQIWTDQPEKPNTPVQAFPEAIAGQSATRKRKLICNAIADKKADWVLLTMPDSIAWLLNIRASDVECTPIALSYLAISKEGRVLWFIDPTRVPAALQEGIELVHPNEMETRLKANLKEAQIATDYRYCPDWFRSTLEDVGAQFTDMKDPCILPRACKTPEEQTSIKTAHITDGVALAKFFAFIDQHADTGEITEVGIDQKLLELRSQAPDFVEPSFLTIAGFAEHGAIIHYRATEESSKTVEGDGLLLVDSGGQYQGGTTDITRTVAIGQPTDEMKENFTRVLKGHIAVVLAQFKPGTIGKEIDVLARQSLREVGLDFAHGTGHGVGCFLAVHEEAASLSPRGEAALQPGMLISNEPGYYKEGAYGIRIENLVLVKEIEGGMLGFETVSLAPIDKRLIVKEMLSKQELEWLNQYHQEVWEKISPALDEADRHWLEKVTTPL